MSKLLNLPYLCDHFSGSLWQNGFEALNDNFQKNLKESKLSDDLQWKEPPAWHRSALFLLGCILSRDLNRNSLCRFCLSL